MNYWRIAAATLAVWLLSIPFGALMHHGVLGAIYAANAAALRPDADIIRRLPIGYGVQLLGFLAATFIYAETSPRRSSVPRGIRFGALLGVVVVSLAVNWNYVTQPISRLVWAAEVFEYMVSALICGAIIGAIPAEQRGTVLTQKRFSVNTSSLIEAPPARGSRPACLAQ